MSFCPAISGIDRKMPKRVGLKHVFTIEARGRCSQPVSGHIGMMSTHLSVWVPSKNTYALPCKSRGDRFIRKVVKNGF